MPYLDLPGLDPASIARGYGIETVQIGSLDELEAFVAAGTEATSPRLAVVPRARFGEAPRVTTCALDPSGAIFSPDVRFAFRRGTAVIRRPRVDAGEPCYCQHHPCWRSRRWYP
jgi:hypothetical protein